MNKPRLLKETNYSNNKQQRIQESPYSRKPFFLKEKYKDDEKDNKSEDYEEKSKYKSESDEEKGK
jgi:hypothetical protein